MLRSIRDPASSFSEGNSPGSSYSRPIHRSVDLRSDVSI